ncbi:MAG: hypothetical protein ACI9MR_001593 [Myxococcota bacterium]|jgi:hypothetical protein
MLERLRKLLGSEQKPLGSAEYRLCRLRHAALHPGAMLWTPGVGGGNLGAGAEAALLDAGMGGDVVVGFQTQVRMPVHPGGVLARVEAVAPLPEGWDTTGIGAEQRFLLRGIQRVDLDVSTCTNKRVPRVFGVTRMGHPDALEAPSETLKELLAALAEIDNHWPEHWLEAFRTLPDAPLGQWATTLGWRLTATERLELLEHPDRIEGTICSALDDLRTGLDPSKRREAVLQQTLTRRTSAMPERRMDVAADTVGWALFHPADADPTELVTDATKVAPELYAPDLALGNVVGVITAEEGNTVVRITSGDLTADEASHRRQDVTMRLFVRHGRLFLGGAALAARNHFQDNIVFADPTHWVDVPNGLYRAHVTAVGRRDAAAENDPSVAASLPDYVLQLSPVENLEALPAVTVLPTL